MKLHEYQAKEIFRKSAIPTPNGQLVTAVDQTAKAIENVKGPPWVIKAQVHAGGRGKGGGVRLAQSPDEAVSFVRSMLGNPLITKQTGPGGVIVHQVLIEEGVDIDREFYLSMIIDRAMATPALIFSQAGGMEIEEVASRSPELILKEHVNLVTGWMPYQGRKLVHRLDPPLSPEPAKALMAIMANMVKLFTSHDCSLLEINPLVTTKDGKVVALDAKLNIDDNSLYRQKELQALDDPREKEPLEVEAEKFGINYIRLDGNIGAMVNGAGLAMATMDVIKLAGAEPANFLDVGGGASQEMVTKGIEIILKDPRVKAILINIFGGILRCDVLARGLLEAARHTEIRAPLIVRLEGTNVEEGREILKNSGLEFFVAKDLAEAAELVAKQVS